MRIEIETNIEILRTMETEMEMDTEPEMAMELEEVSMLLLEISDMIEVEELDSALIVLDAASDELASILMVLDTASDELDSTLTVLDATSDELGSDAKLELETSEADALTEGEASMLELTSEDTEEGSILDIVREASKAEELVIMADDEDVSAGSDDIAED